jgi:hypothetical protein
MDEFHFLDPRPLFRPSEVFDPVQDRNMVKTEVTGVNICQVGGDQEEKTLTQLNQLPKLPGLRGQKIKNRKLSDVRAITHGKRIRSHNSPICGNSG